MTPFFSLKPAAVCGTAAEYPAVRFGRGGDDIHANTLEAACHVPARTVTDGRDALRTVSSVWRCGAAGTRINHEIRMFRERT